MSDAELLATLFPGAKALQLAQQTLNACGGWAGLQRSDYRDLSEQVSSAKAARIKAALEIGRRLLLAGPERCCRLPLPYLCYTAILPSIPLLYLLCGDYAIYYSPFPCYVAIMQPITRRPCATWYVTVEAPGYARRVSALVGVPPEVTDLDLNLTPLIDTPVPTLGFGSETYAVAHGTSSITVAVQLSLAAPRLVTVQYRSAANAD